MPNASVSLRSTWRNDFASAVVVMLVALPLCLGIALASGAPLAAGLISGVLGGVVVASLSGSPLMISGPAAGLASLVLVGISTLGSFRAVLVAVAVSGALQMMLSAVRAGIVGYYIPSCVLRGMVAAIGMILIFKQLPHALGSDVNFEGDEAFVQANAQTTFSSLGAMFDDVHAGAIVISLVALALLVGWDRLRHPRLAAIPAPLVAVLSGVALNAAFALYWPDRALAGSHLVQLPVAQRFTDMLAFFTWPDWRVIGSPAMWTLAVSLAVVASLETLLALDATDKLDPYKRESDTNRELFAQGVGNTLAGLLGGLPMSGVIVRSSANIDAGAQTRLSAILHGAMLTFAVLATPALLNRIPLAAIAAILLYTGFKLASPALFAVTWRQGRSQFVPFAVTAVAILLTDLLVGIGIGLGVALFLVLLEHLRHPALRRISIPGAVLTRYALPTQATFLDKANIERTLQALPKGSRVEIDGRNTTRFDADVLEQLHEFRETARLRDIDYRLVGIPDGVTTPAHGLVPVPDSMPTTS